MMRNYTANLIKRLELKRLKPFKIDKDIKESSKKNV